jgi:hypothetical protein
MSHYVNITTAIKDQKALVKGLGRLGFDASKIEIYSVPQNLYGYKGDKRQEVAHVILRRKYVGGVSNDIGFERKSNGFYAAHISEYDHGQYGNEWQGKLIAYYGVELAKMELENNDMEYIESMDKEGRPHLMVCNL